jgi:hypothetical protein
MHQREIAPHTLRAAAALLEKEGWSQGAVRGQNGGRCALQAIADSGITNVERFFAELLLDDYLMTTYKWARGVIHWNDDPSRTQEEVINAMREAADVGIFIK